MKSAPSPSSTTGDGGPAATPPAGPSRGRRSILALAAGIVAAVLLGVGLLVFARPSANANQGGAALVSQAPPAHLDHSAVSLLGLSVLGRSNFRPPNFTLTDQHGNTVSLASLEGKVVVLSFNDDRCPDLCTLLAQSIVLANRDLGPAAKRIVFLSVNVNPFYPQVRYIRQWADQHHLGTSSNWVSTTGPVPKLESIWHRYGVYVGLDHKTRTVTHGTELFFIDPSGKERAIGSFGVPAANTPLFAHDMAQMADDLLPASQQATVGGPTTLAPTRSDAAVDAPAPSFDLPVAASTGRPGQPANATRTVSSAGLKGHYAVIDFFSGSCGAACRRQLANVERASQQLGSKVRVVGIDTSGQAASPAASPAATGLALARDAAVTFPVAVDHAGRVARAYRAPGGPFAVIVGPHGTILVRHPGVLTTEQLTYILRSEMPGGGR